MTLPPERDWNTWDPRYPAAVVHLPSGLMVRLAAYSTRARRYTTFPFDVETVRLGRHAADGSFIEVELMHAGSRLRLRFAKPDPFTLVGDVSVEQTAEWGLRFWYVLEAGFEGDGVMRVEIPEGEARYIDPPVALATYHAGSIALGPSIRPVDAGVYHDVSEIGTEFEGQGYYARPPGRPEGSWVAFRFTGDTRQTGFAAAAGSDADQARDRLRAALSLPERIQTEHAIERTGTRAAAIRDVVAWNTTWDAVNERPTTSVTRFWILDKFGGWIVWHNDALYHALLAAHASDWETARANLSAALAGQTPAGNFPALQSALTGWDDRSHPPIGALMVWSLYAGSGDRALLETWFPALLRAYRWWFRERDGNRNGVLEYGSSPVGDGHFVHTKLAALDEASMDNSPIFDEAVFDVATHTLDQEDVALNSLLVLEGDLLGRMAEILGRGVEARGLRESSEALAARVRDQLWDEEREIFANRLWNGRFARSLAPTSFYPLLAGIATREQAEVMVRKHLLNPAEFWGDYPVAGTPHDDPASLDNTYWRGRVWPPMNFLTYLALRRYRFDDIAAELAQKGLAMFERGWRERRSYENFNQRTGEGGDSVDADPFYTWGALLPLIAEMEHIGLDPWDGLSFGSPARWTDAADLSTPHGPYRVELDGGTRLLVRGALLLEAPFRGRFRHLEHDEHELSVEIPPVNEESHITFAVPVAEARLDGAMVDVGSDRSISLPPAGKSRRLSVRLERGAAKS